MSAAAHVLHNIFNEIVEEYHPFAEYEGFAEVEGGFILRYRGPNGEQHMLLDSDCNVIDDTTLGTTRTMGIVALGASLLAAFLGVPQNQ